MALLLACASICSVGQTNVNEEKGMKPYDSWHGGDLDSVSMTNGGLVLHIPLVSFPQRGSLDLSFSVYSNTKQWATWVNPLQCGNPNDPNGCTPMWKTAPHGAQIGFGNFNLEGAYVASSQDWIPANVCNVEPGNDNNGNVPTYHWSASLTAPDGNAHSFGSSNTACPGPPFRALDASGILMSDSNTILFPNGTRFNFPNYPNPTTITDANGNRISVDGNIGTFTDTIGRVITPPVGATATDVSGCPSGTASARTWTVPGLAGGTRTFKFCYSSVSIYTNFGQGATEYGPANNSLLTAIVLPDSTLWTFAYDHYGDVTRLGFPTGGSISYTYAIGPVTCGVGTPLSMIVTSRTVNANDGAGGHTWTYTYTAPGTSAGSMVVTSPEGNETVHSIGDPITGTFSCTLVDLQVKNYQGSHSGGTLLKTAATQYSANPNPLTDPDSGGASDINVVPAQTTVTWPDGHSSKVVNTWDSGNSESPFGTAVPLVLGSLLQKDEYDYSNTLVRSTVNHYLWQDNATYKSNNFLGLKVSSTLKDGTGNQMAQTTFAYDQTAVTSSGITTGLVAPPAGGNIRGNQTTVSHWLNATNSFLSSTVTYLDTGMAASSTPPPNADGLNRTTTYTYSSTFFGAYMTQTNMPDTGSPAIHHVISGNYDFNTGLLVSFTDENSQTYTYQYDSVMLRLTQGNHPDGGQTIFTYPDPNTVERQQLISGSTYDTVFAKFDGVGRPIQSQHVMPNGVATVLADTTYDVMGRVSTVSNPYYQGTSHSSDPTYGVTTTQYDALGRPIKTIKQDNNFSTVAYNTTPDNGSGSSVMCTTATDEAGKKRQVCNDALGRMVKVFEDPSGLNYETDYQYDVLGNMMRVDQKGSAPTDSAQWRTRTFVYDSLSRLLTASNPESGTITYTYDADGNVSAKTDARSIATSLTYDALNRVVTKNYSDGTLGAGYTYDQTGVWGTPGNNAIGRLVLVYDGNHAATLFSYDLMGRINQQWDCPPSAWANGGCNSVKAQYNQMGDLTQLTYPDSRVVTNGYNSANQLNQVQFASWNGTTVGVNYWSVTDTNFYPSDTPKTVTLGNGLTENATINPRLQLQEGTIVSASLGTLADHVYNYGAQNNGNVLSVSDQISSAFTQTFTYDSLNRLATANESRWGMSYLYDAWGNYLQQNQTGGTTYQHQYTAASNNRLHGYTYDASGNMLNDGFHQYTFDGNNRISQVDSGGTRYTYDPTVGRVRKDSGSNVTEYYYFGGAVIAEQNVTTGAWDDYIYANGKRIAKAPNYEDRILISGTNCSSCGPQSTLLTFGGLAWLPYVVQNGDRLFVRMKEDAGNGGIVLSFSNGSSTRGSLTDTNGTLLNADNVSTAWHVRIANLAGYAGKSLTSIALVSETTSGPGLWQLKYKEMSLVSADGTVHPIYVNETSVNLTPAATGGVTGITAAINHNPWTTVGPPNMGTIYYHGDQIGSSRLLTSESGYPVWQGTFLPYGEEYNAQISTNHYKFTGKERDAESGLDYFGARYYANVTGRFMSPDWAAKPTSVPYAEFGDPQSLNLYSYVRNSPIVRMDADGHNYAGWNGSYADTTAGTPMADWSNMDEDMKYRDSAGSAPFPVSVDGDTLLVNPNVEPAPSTAPASSSVPSPAPQHHCRTAAEGCYVVVTSDKNFAPADKGDMATRDITYQARNALGENVRDVEVKMTEEIIAGDKNPAGTCQRSCSNKDTPQQAGFHSGEFTDSLHVGLLWRHSFTVRQLFFVEDAQVAIHFGSSIHWSQTVEVRNDAIIVRADATITPIH